MVVNQRDKSAAVLTTQKVQALLDAGLNTSVRCRRSLATEMTRGGEKISVHGVEGWFKHVDSNYAADRVSLHPDLKSYPVPKRRWGAILDLFPVEIEDISLGDEAFRQWCFDRGKHSQYRTVSETESDHLNLVFVLYAQLDGEQIYDELLWLRDQGLNIWWDTSVQDGSQWSEAIVTVIEKASVCLVYRSNALVQSARCQRELELASSHNKKILVSNLSAVSARDAQNELLDDTVLLERGKGDDTYRQALQAQLRAHMGHQHTVAEAPAGASPILDKPSIAVLPFTNLTGHQDFYYVAQGITEDLITLLSRMPELFVISRTASNAYAGMLADHRVVYDHLGVRFALEGSVRRLADRVRVTAMLTDLVSGQQLWAETFEGLFDGLFEMQDEITTRICAQLIPKVVMGSLDYGSRTVNFETWRYWHLGWFKLFVDPPVPALKESLDSFHKALEHQPDYALAHAGIANAMGTGMLWGGIGPEEYPTAKKHAETAFRLLPDNPAVIYAMGMIAYVEPRPVSIARDWVQQAVDIEPSNAAYVAALGYLTANAGDAEKGLDICRKAVRLSPGDMRQPFINYMLSSTHIAAGNFAIAIETMLLSDRLQSVDWVWLMIAFSRYKLGDAKGMNEAIKKCIAVGSRGMSLYQYSLINRLWPQFEEQDKAEFLRLCADQGIS